MFQTGGQTDRIQLLCQHRALHSERMRLREKICSTVEWNSHCLRNSVTSQMHRLHSVTSHACLDFASPTCLDLWPQLASYANLCVSDMYSFPAFSHFLLSLVFTRNDYRVQYSTIVYAQFYFYYQNLSPSYICDHKTLRFRSMGLCFLTLHKRSRPHAPYQRSVVFHCLWDGGWLEAGKIIG